MDVNKPVPLDVACNFFPKPLCKKSLLRRIHDGIDGIRLEADFDGFRYYTSQQRVTDFLIKVREHRDRECHRLSTPVMSEQEEYERALAKFNAL